MNNPTFKDFKAFLDRVANTTPNREINHSIWDTCVVGDFAREEMGKPNEDCYNLAEQLFGLANETDLNTFMAWNGNADTYGEFRDQLDDFLRDHPEAV